LLLCVTNSNNNNYAGVDRVFTATMSSMSSNRLWRWRIPTPSRQKWSLILRASSLISASNDPTKL